MSMTPFSKSWWVEPGRLLAGCYPGAPEPATAEQKLVALLDAGIRNVICLQEEDERSRDGAPFRPYLDDLRRMARERGEIVGWSRRPIQDLGVPTRAAMSATLDEIDKHLARQSGLYVHCWGGHGRTATVIGCWLVRHGRTGHEALERIRELRQHDPYLTGESAPQTDAQRDLVLNWQERESISIRDRFRGCLLGLAIGDAVGTTLEFKPPGTFEPIDDMVGGGPFGLEPGQWTDDTSLALCLAESLVECGGFDPVDQLQRYVRWWTEGYWSSNGTCFDIGNATASALRRFRTTGEPWCGSTDPRTAGNGSLMRLAPVPMAFASDLHRAIELAGQSSRTTHAANECLDACRYFARVIVEALRGNTKNEILQHTWDPSLEALAPKVAHVADGSFLGKEPPDIRGAGYVVNSLEAALWAFSRTSSFRDGLLKAVNLGDDADTTGAIYGQLAGAHYGIEAIPETWRARVARREEILELADRLLGLCNSEAKGERNWRELR